MTLKISKRALEAEAFNTLGLLAEDLEHNRKNPEAKRVNAGAGVPGKGAPGLVDWSYIPAAGSPAFREGVARFLMQREGIEINPRRVIGTMSGSNAIQIGLGLCLDPEDIVVDFVPGYGPHRVQADWLALDRKTEMLRPEEDYRLTVDLLDATKRKHPDMQAVTFASPGNPITSMSDIDAIGSWLRDNNIRGFCDAAYIGLDYERQIRTTLQSFPDSLVFLTGSKFLAMPGARVGAVVVPEDMIEQAEKMVLHLNVCPVAGSDRMAADLFNELAGWEDYDPETGRYLGHWVEKNRQRCEDNKDVMVETLAPMQDAGDISFVPIEGGIFAYVTLMQDFNSSSLNLVRHIRARTNVTMGAGSDFGGPHADRSLRITFGGSTQDVKEIARATAQLPCLARELSGTKAIPVAVDL